MSPPTCLISVQLASDRIVAITVKMTSAEPAVARTSKE
jgi:hypothetical protein